MRILQWWPQVDIPELEYREILEIVTRMINAQDINDIKQVWVLYNKLKTICDNSASVHPFFYETLADFTSDLNLAMPYYRQALKLASELSLNLYLATVQFSIAERYFDQNDKEVALDWAKNALESAIIANNDELKNEINELIMNMRI